MNKKKARDKDTKETSTIAVKRAYDYIRDLTIDFSIRPGEQINETEVASILDMSRVPVREALNRLVMGGFVYFDHGKGFFCRKFSETEMKDLYGVRYDMEMGAVKQACETASEEDVSQLLNEWEAVANDKESQSNKELILLDEEFHIRLVSLAGNAERVNYLQNIYERIRFVRTIVIEDEERRNAIITEHISLLRALMNRDLEQTTELLEYHLGVNSKVLRENIRTGMLRIYAADMT